MDEQQFKLIEEVPSLETCLKLWNSGFKLKTKYCWRRMKGKAQCVIETPQDEHMIDRTRRGFKKFFTYPDIDDHLIPAPDIKEMLDFLPDSDKTKNERIGDWNLVLFRLKKEWVVDYLLTKSPISFIHQQIDNMEKHLGFKLNRHKELKEALIQLILSKVNTLGLIKKEKN